MKDQLTEEEALEIIRTAFAPLRCVAERTDYQYYRFRVFNDDDDGILKAPHIDEGDISSRRSLGGLIALARTRVEERGYILEPWVMPGDSPGAT